VVISGHQWSSVVISGHPRSSEVIRGHQWSSVIISSHQRSSEVIRGRPRSSVVISGHPSHILARMRLVQEADRLKEREQVATVDEFHHQI